MNENLEEKKTEKSDIEYPPEAGRNREREVYSEAVAHLSASYENAQRTIRMLDAKVSGILVFVTSLVGASGLLTKWLIEILAPELKQFNSWHPLNGVQLTTILAVLLLIAFLFFTGMAVRFALKCLIPRDPGGTSTVLFPYWVSDKKTDSVSEEHLDKFVEGCDLELAKEEFATQIRIVGSIVSQKLTACQKSVKWLQWVVWMGLGFALSSTVVYATTNGLFG